MGLRLIIGLQVQKNMLKYVDDLFDAKKFVAIKFIRSRLITDT